MKTQTIHKEGEKPITFHPGGLHKSLGIKQGEKIPKSKMMAAMRGDYGKLAASRARFAKNVLIGFSDFSNGVSRAGEQKVNIRTTGSGPAITYIDGKKTVGTWKRPTQDSILRFYDETGTEVKLNPGTTWIEFVPQGTAVE